MQVVFIRHASAEPAGAGGDQARRLTGGGRKESKATGGAIRALGLKLQQVLTSPLVRASETAQIVAEAHGGVEVAPADFLAPPGDGEALRKHLAKLNRRGVETVALVGHAPSLDELIAAALGVESIASSLNKAGAACVELPPAGSSDRPELLWLMRRKQLAALAGKK